MLEGLKAKFSFTQALPGKPELIEQPLESNDNGAFQASISAAEIKSASARLYSPLPADQQNQYIDPRIFTAMVASERVLERVGDIYDAIAARTDYYSAGLVITHNDKAIETKYREWAERVNLDYWLADSHLTTGIYGQSYPVFYGNGEESLSFCFSPKSVAVGDPNSMGQRPMIYIGKNSNGLYSNMAANNLTMVEDNEWPMPGTGADNFGSATFARFNPDRIYQRTAYKVSFKRYNIPPAVRAWDEITARITLGEMIKDTTAALKTQIRVWTLENPMQGEISSLATTVRSMKAKRVYDLIWRKGLEVKSVVPETVSELLADRTWMSMTDRCMRMMGLQLVLASGELMSGNTSGSTGSDGETQVLTAITRLESVMRENIRIARWLMSMYRATSGDAALERAELPNLYYRETMLTMDQKVRSIVPLLSYGAISIRSTQERVGLDPDVEMERLKQELPLRGTVIQPYAGFGQVSNGNETSSERSPGRPRGMDTDPENAQTNRENAQNGRK